MLEVKDLTIEYENTTTVRDISFTVDSGEVYSIIGKSGCGKSTILNAISGMLGRNGKITSGTISLAGNVIFENGKYTPYLKKVLGKQLATISQHPDGSFDPLFTIGDQMTEVMRVNERITKKDARIKGCELLSRLHFSDPERVWNSYPHELSGGMCQRVAVAMALSNKATILLADEPTSALDVTSQAEFIKQLKEIVENDDLAVLLVTHNMAVAKALADRTGYLRDGELSEYGGEVFAVTAS
ncbi:MAG: ABC transporter ATP-binding protein [Butyrivibrio sp.]|nr:ABC transporter ATP-binding protein [Butyrivibrio sp.]